MAKKVRNRKRKKTLTQGSADDFVTVARQLECDEDKARFERQLAKIARAKPAFANARNRPICRLMTAGPRAGLDLLRFAA